ncbi:MAG TPA: bifunctional phosphopantothenoylcysteine decarboxylase/phosphopantothenate--cysteine ligase CoaBC [Longimicrobiales bacterium]
MSEGRAVAPLTPRRPWQGRKILLGVAGGIAAYKSVQIARDLSQLGATVDVILTSAARSFVGPITFEAVTGRPVHSDLIAEGSALDHIKLARNCDVVCVAPATADLLARAASGRADDLLTAVLLATKSPVILCPAMNDQMWAHPQVQLNAVHVRDVLGYQLVGPGRGALAYGEGVGAGRMEEGSVIIEYIGRALENDEALRGKHIVVTAGPTREPVDPVRVLSNRSSGKMGYAIAAAAWRRGASVTLISGPTSLADPIGINVQRVETAEQMASAVRESISAADALIMAAAVADFRPANVAGSKIKKQAAVSAIELEPAPDILKSTRDARATQLRVVGFALETDAHEENARKKLAEKGLDFIVLNDAREAGAGFEVDTNKVTILRRDSDDVEHLPLLPKDQVADAILDRLAALY